MSAAPDLARAVADIHEGYRLHYGRPGGDPDLALLDGDRLYADGLDGLARLGDLGAVARMADVIASCAQAHAAQDPDRARDAWAAVRDISSG